MNEGAAGATRPFLLGIAGDSGSGKTTLAEGVRALLGPECVATIELDDYHRFTRAERRERRLTALNPAVHDLGLMHEHLGLLRRGRPVRNRRYEHADGTFGPMHVTVPNDVVLARGLLGFPTDELRAAYDLAVFLLPEPDLLFRWKLRRDVKTRGYTQAEVLKRIAQHLLDAKQYVLPQADRADLVIRFDLPTWDAPDSEVRTTLLLRRAAADALRADALDARFGEAVAAEEADDGTLLLHLAPTLTSEQVDDWAAEQFPGRVAPDGTGVYMDEAGEPARSAAIAFAQVFVADLTRRLRAREPAAAGGAANE